MRLQFSDAKALFQLKREWRPAASTKAKPAGGGANGFVSDTGGPFSGGQGGSFTAANSTDESAGQTGPEETAELKKIKKVQSFFRGWLCRRRWKQIVEQYIKSPHAESMRKRNRDFRSDIRASTPVVSSGCLVVSLVSEIGLLGDLFDMLLPMLGIYQEYVRNHHYSLQVLTECKQQPEFVQLLKRLEMKPACQGRSLEMFLTFPMHQIPRYIVTLHELLAHTPHDHVERKSLQNARQQLEDLSRQMHDEVSETENLRKNLAVERLIVEGCDILLDVNQVFVRQGTLIQFPTDKPKSQRIRLSHFKSEKEIQRQCFLFSNHLIMENSWWGIGKWNDSVCSLQSHHSGLSENVSFQNRDFKMIVAVKATSSSQAQNLPPLTVHLIAPTIQEKAAWVSDITQCMDSVHYNNLLRSTLTETASITMLSAIRHDPNLFRDDVDIKYLHHRNPQRVGGGGYCYESQTIPHIVYATKEKLLENLTDLRFVSIDFLNTFLLTYRAFTNGVTVLEALRKAFYNAEPPDSDQDQEDEYYATKAGQHHHHHPGPGPGGEFESTMSLDDISLSQVPTSDTLPIYTPERRRSSTATTSRRISGASSGYASEIMGDGHRESFDSTCHFPKTTRRSRKYEEDKNLGLIKESSGHGSQSPGTQHRKISIRVDKPQEASGSSTNLNVPSNNIAGSSSNETLTGSTSEITVLSGPSSPGNISQRTLVGQDPMGLSSSDTGQMHEEEFKPTVPSTTTTTSPSGATSSSVTSSTTTTPATSPPQQSLPTPQSSPQGSRPSTSGSSTPQSVKTSFSNAGSPQSPKPCHVTGVPQSPKLASVQGTSGPPPSPKTVRPTTFLEEKIGGPKSPKLIPRPPTTAPIPHIHTSSFLLDKNPPPPPPRIFKETPHHRQHRHSHQEETMPQLKEPAFAQDSTRLGPERQSRSASLSHILMSHRGSDANVQHFPIRKRSVADDDPYLSEDNDCWNLSAHSSRSASIATTNALYAGRRSIGCCEGESAARQATPRASFQQDSPQHSSKAGVVITSFRKSQRRKRKMEDEVYEEDKNLGLIKESSGHGSQSPGTQHRKISIRVDKPQETSGSSTNLNVPSNNIAGSSSNETLTGSTSEITVLSGPSSPGNISQRTLVGQDPMGLSSSDTGQMHEEEFKSTVPSTTTTTSPSGATSSSVTSSTTTTPATSPPQQSLPTPQSSPQGSRPSTSGSSTPQSVKTSFSSAGSPQSPKPCHVTGVPQSPKLASVQGTSGPPPSPKTVRPTTFLEEKIGGPKSPKLIPRPPTTAPIPHIHTSSFLLDKNPPPPPPRIFKETPHHRQHRHSHQEETMPQLKEPAFAQDSTRLGPERQSRFASLSHILMSRRGSDANVQHFPIRNRSVAGDDPYLSEDKDCWNLSAHSSRSASIATTNALYSGRRSIGCCEGESAARQTTPRASFQQDSPQHSSKAGVVFTSFRKSQRSFCHRHERLQSSTSTAATAFAIATSASSNPRDISPVEEVRNKRKESVLSTATTMRVLNVLRHWISKHTQDFIQDKELRYMTLEFLEEIVCTPNLLPAEYKAATQLTRMLTKEECTKHETNLQDLLAPPQVANKENIETLSALEIAEQMTYIDYHIFKSIRSEEFLGQAWLKSEKLTKAPHIVLFTQRFNTMSKLVANEILNRSNLSQRVHVIEKWIAVADILKCLNNFNGVLTIISAMNNSSVFRLKKTWDKVSKTTKQTYDELRQVVDAEENFHNFKSKLQHCDPPCIPYLGMYLTEFARLDEEYPTFTKEGETNLVNFTKIRRMANTIRDITRYQNTPYKIEYNPKVANYILDTSWIIEDEDVLHQKSMEIEPRTTGRPSCAQLPNLPLSSR
ncbi:ras-specific guanine nucleotide-releasing factor 2-like [Diaphorina citri]|uniref:Ras-specific guanine nucleotide-releasing factor 2-like n=1 Tax=Diaphorina citri TaxID=121845 RepID=A0A3Q0IW63_DIACI|nr:ras-specific guanine nucleotide-releasing factor 2-like [Diaphorina citri]